jgi:hypothetical protein
MSSALIVLMKTDVDQIVSDAKQEKIDKFLIHIMVG